MIRKNKGKLLVSSVLILLPIVFGLIFWNELPEQIAIHWGVDGQPDGWGDRAFAVFGLPLILLALHWFTVFVTGKDPKNSGQNPRVIGLAFWLVPAVSLLLGGIIYATSLGKEFQPTVFVPLFLGLLFMVLGYCFPKCKQNRTVGIKVKWTLENEENWNATHRLAGKVWMIGGFLLLFCALLPDGFIFPGMFAIVLALVVIPIVFSYCCHKRQAK